MSYHLQYIKKQVLQPEDIDRIAENKAGSEDEHYFSPDEQRKIAEKIKSAFPDFRDEDVKKDDYEIHYNTVSVDMATNGALVTVLYWNDDIADDVESRVRRISEIFTEAGFTCFNRQSQEFIHNQEEIDGMFEDAPWVVEQSLTRTARARTKPDYVLIVLGIVIIAVVIAMIVLNV